ncbi:GGDEF domain-containing protein, partial [Enterococcus faecium]
MLNLSELASTLTEMSEFYPAIHSLVNQDLPADNFYLVLLDAMSGHFRLEYFSDEKDQLDAAGIDSEVFANGLTGYVARQKKYLLCDAELFQQLLKEGEIQSQGTPSQHWLGVPLCRG